MNKFRQNLLKLKYHKLRTTLITLLFTVLFSALLIFMILYENTEENFQYMTRYTVNQLILSERYVPIGYYILDDLEKNPDVYDYNVLDSSGWGERFVDIEPVIADAEIYAEYLKRIEVQLAQRGRAGEEPTEGTLYGVKSSKTCVYFLTQGYELIEGRHIQDSDTDKNSVLISRELAERNGLKLGDTFSVAPSEAYHYSAEKEYKLKIVGIFTAPVIGVPVRPTDDPCNFMIMHYKALGTDFYHKTVEANHMQGVSGVNIFLNDRADAEAFIENFKKLHVSMESDYYFYNNKEWTDILLHPLREMRIFSRMLMLIFLAGIAIILVILSAFLIEKERHEIRLLFAVGERRRKILHTVLIGQLLPVWLGGVLAMGIAVGVSETAGDYLAESYYKNSESFAEELLASDVELYDKGEVYMSAPERMTMNVDQKIEFRLNAWIVLIYLLVLAVGIPVIVYIQCGLRLRRI